MTARSAVTRRLDSSGGGIYAFADANVSLIRNSAPISGNSRLTNGGELLTVGAASTHDTGDISLTNSTVSGPSLDQQRRNNTSGGGIWSFDNNATDIITGRQHDRSGNTADFGGARDRYSIFGDLSVTSSHD